MSPELSPRPGAGDQLSERQLVLVDLRRRRLLRQVRERGFELPVKVGVGLDPLLEFRHHLGVGVDFLTAGRRQRR